MPRPRGRRYGSYSISLTLEQIQYLDTQPNPSELMRTLLEHHMKAEVMPQIGESIELLKAKLERCESDHAELEQEFWTWIDDHEKQLFEEGYGQYRKKDGKPAFKQKGADRLIKIYRDYERRLKGLDDAKIKLRQAIAEAEEGGTEVA